MRGKALKTMPKQRHCRITPAYAGKSAGYQSGRCGNQDHPRLCGEKYHMPLRVSPRAGSPPPMRGKGHNRKAEKGGLRITPAYAGKSCRNRGTDCNIWDHPRLCGEKKPTRHIRAIDTGITPAYAGKSHFRKIFFRPFRDHPRLCGEKKLDREEAKDLGGITPAYAGKRTNQYEPVDYSQDHPRLCGEKSPSRCRFLPCHVDHPRLCGEKMI